MAEKRLVMDDFRAECEKRLKDYPEASQDRALIFLHGLDGFLNPVVFPSESQRFQAVTTILDIARDKREFPTVWQTLQLATFINTCRPASSEEEV